MSFRTPFQSRFCHRTMKCSLSCLRDPGGVPSHDQSKRGNELLKNCNYGSDSCQLFQQPVLLAKTDKQADGRKQQTLIRLLLLEMPAESLALQPLCCTLQPEVPTAPFLYLLAKLLPISAKLLQNQVQQQQPCTPCCPHT